MRRFLLLISIAAIFASLLPAGEFEWMVRQVSRESGVEPMHIPFFGLARFVVAVGHPAGATDLHLAVFENTEIAPEHFARMIDSAAGSSWKPMIRVRSRNGESTNIYLQQAGKQVRLLIGTLERNQSTLIEVRVKPEELIRFVDEHEHRH
ncbi:MAG TPA: hypothetical protein VN737_09060 [Bryobacteraceae bacterium]|jgi:hypothetical protein|nr:hypothetical protein [Bryobacteraceae bacterium]